MSQDNRYRVAVLPGDGIGVEVIDSAMEVLNVVQEKIGGFEIEPQFLPAGA